MSPIAIVAHLGWALISMVVSTSLMWPASMVVGMVGVFVVAGCTITLVTSALVERLPEEATTDPLTGLANRATFGRALVQAQATVVRTEVPLSLLLIDLDGFKTINDRYGHAAGDAVLQQAGASWSELLRDRDTAFARVPADVGGWSSVAEDGGPLGVSDPGEAPVDADPAQVDGCGSTTSSGQRRSVPTWIPRSDVPPLCAHAPRGGGPNPEGVHGTVRSTSLTSAGSAAYGSAERVSPTSSWDSHLTIHSPKSLTLKKSSVS